MQRYQSKVNYNVTLHARFEYLGIRVIQNGVEELWLMSEEDFLSMYFKI